VKQGLPATLNRGKLTGRHTRLFRMPHFRRKVRKPFADYRPMPAISPYSYLHADDPYDVPYYYLYVKPLLETQSPDDY